MIDLDRLTTRELTNVAGLQPQTPSHRTVSVIQLGNKTLKQAPIEYVLWVMPDKSFKIRLSYTWPENQIRLLIKIDFGSEILSNTGKYSK